MEYFGKGLYLIFFALVFWFIHRAHGRGLGRQYKKWMEDAK